MLLHANASLTICDNSGKTALDIAKARGQVECAVSQSVSQSVSHTDTHSK